MSCFNPMIAVNTGRVNPGTGKKEYKFLKSLRNWTSDEELRKYGEPEWFEYSDTMLGHGVPLVDLETGEVVNRAVVLPCGQCLGCRTAYAAQWADRIMLESLAHDESYFLTLTYADAHVPIRFYSPDKALWDRENFRYDPITGTFSNSFGDTCSYDELVGLCSRLRQVMSLDSRDLTLFLKRLRRFLSYHHDVQVRFYAVGEYGSLKHRPHYHIIVFGLHLDDLYEIGRNKAGRMLHSSKIIEKLWPYGRVEVDKLTWESAAYTARYTVKKLGKAETDFYKEFNIVPEFSRMSLKPGIGQKYFDENAKTIYEYDKIHISTSSGVRTVKPPRFYDQKYDDIYPTGMKDVKANRKEIARQHVRAKLQNYSGSYFELLEAEERAFKARTKSLRRELEDG